MSDQSKVSAEAGDRTYSNGEVKDEDPAHDESGLTPSRAGVHICRERDPSNEEEQDRKERETRKEDGTSAKVLCGRQGCL